MFAEVEDDEGDEADEEDENAAGDEADEHRVVEVLGRDHARIEDKGRIDRDDERSQDSSPLPSRTRKASTQPIKHTV